MMFFNDECNLKNRSKVAKCVFLGMTVSQIAMELKCSKSCVSYHIKKMYEKYKAKTRSQFILKVLTQSLNNHKQLVELKNEQIISLSNENQEIKTIVSGCSIKS